MVREVISVSKETKNKLKSLAATKQSYEGVIIDLIKNYTEVRKWIGDCLFRRRVIVLVRLGVLLIGEDSNEFWVF